MDTQTTWDFSFVGKANVGAYIAMVGGGRAFWLVATMWVESERTHCLCIPTLRCGFSGTLMFPLCGGLVYLYFLVRQVPKQNFVFVRR